MRLICLTLAVALTLAPSSPAFAPAPAPKRDRETAPQKRERELAALVECLRGMGVKWELVSSGGGRAVRYSVEVNFPGGGGSMSGELDVTDGDLQQALRHLVRQSEQFHRQVESLIRKQ